MNTRCAPLRMMTSAIACACRMSDGRGPEEQAVVVDRGQRGRGGRRREQHDAGADARAAAQPRQPPEKLGPMIDVDAVGDQLPSRRATAFVGSVPSSCESVCDRLAEHAAGRVDVLDRQLAPGE